MIVSSPIQITLPLDSSLFLSCDYQRQQCQIRIQAIKSSCADLKKGILQFPRALVSTLYWQDCINILSRGFLRSCYHQNGTTRMGLKYCRQLSFQCNKKNSLQKVFSKFSLPCCTYVEFWWNFMSALQYTYSNGQACI